MSYCRNCESQLITKDKNLICFKCHSAYLDLLFIKPYFRESDFKNLETDLKSAKSKSSHNCLLCKKQMTLHFIRRDIQVESCYPCRKIWFDTDEINKFQNYTNLRNEEKYLTFEDRKTLIPLTEYLLQETLDSNFLSIPRYRTIGKVAAAEFGANYIGDKITETSLFKKYPVLTFCLVMAVIIGYFYLTRPNH